MKIFLRFILPFFLIISCEKKCPNEFLQYNATIIYKNGEIIRYKNDTLGIKHDTVHIIKSDIINETYYDDSDYCPGKIGVIFSSGFSVFYWTHIEYGNAFIVNEPFGTSDTMYIKNGDTVPACKLSFKIDNPSDYPDLFKYGKSYYYNNYIFIKEPVILLLEYTTYDTISNETRTWKLDI